MKILTDKQLESLLWNAEQKGYNNGCAKGFNFGYEEGYRSGVTHKQSNDDKKPLLTITLTDIDAVPIVHYKGKQIDRKLRVAFDWESQSIDKINRTYIHIERVPFDNKRCNTEIIQHNQPIVGEKVELFHL
ncbi:hypothetical protein [Bacillus mycoides]|uniref:hypothetical protein n=1 Tax=Bacillus mycoides TaxID=1405 RepID=UPI001F33C1B3|nr:hypothetical protein [Bacillus mycoides]